jgi:hypothetical protein
MDQSTHSAAYSARSSQLPQNRNAIARSNRPRVAALFAMLVVRGDDQLMPPFSQISDSPTMTSFVHISNRSEG